jgi:hypothetical protein
MAPIRYHRLLYIRQQKLQVITNHRARLVTSFTSITQYYSGHTRRQCSIDPKCLAIHHTRILHSTLLNNRSYLSNTQQHTALAAPSVRVPTQMRTGPRSQISQNVEEYRTALLNATTVSVLIA